MNYFEYFSEIEERFIARRGSVLLLSTLDWALIETWREAGVPLAAVLRGIDDAFDKYEARKTRARGRIAKVNGLAWCAQAVMAAATGMAEAAVGVAVPAKTSADTGFETARIAGFLARNAASMERAVVRETVAPIVELLASTGSRLRELAAEVSAEKHPALDELDRTLTVLEERLLAGVVASLPEQELLALRGAAEGALAPLLARMGAVQLRQVRESYMQKQLFASRGLPRLSLFYMPLEHVPIAGADRNEAAA